MSKQRIAELEAELEAYKKTVFEVLDLKADSLVVAKLDVGDLSPNEITAFCEMMGQSIRHFLRVAYPAWEGDVLIVPQKKGLPSDVEISNKDDLASCDVCGTDLPKIDHYRILGSDDTYRCTGCYTDICF